MCVKNLSQFCCIGKGRGASQFYKHEDQSAVEMPRSHKEVGAKHIADTEHFQTTCREPIPPLVGEFGEVIELNDELVEDPTIASLSGTNTNAQYLEESLDNNDEENDEDTLIAM